MFKRKIRKCLHFIRCALSQRVQLKNISNHSKEGAAIVQAFLETKNNSFLEEKKQFEALEKYRENLTLSNESISFKEIGVDKNIHVRDVVKKAASPIQWSKFLYSLTKQSQSRSVLEIGTNLGISGQYFVEAIKGNPKAKLTTMEGVKRMCEIAEQQLNARSNKNKVEVLHGLYDQSLEKIAKSKERYDLVFIDGNHTYTATIKYFNLLKANYKPNTILIIDDINWSSEMQKAWKELRKDPLVLASIDLFKLGILILGSKDDRENNYHLFLNF